METAIRCKHGRQTFLSCAQCEREAKPYKITKTTFQNRPAELMTFTGTTSEEYDTFLDARFGDGYEPIGFRTDAGAKAGKLEGCFHSPGSCIHWFQYRRKPV